MQPVELPGSAHVLVVDDQAGMRLTLKGILGRRGLRVSVAEDGIDALRAAQLQPFDAFLLDIKMPGISGVETFLRLKEFCPKAAVIMMTAHASEDEVRQALDEGALAVLQKPLDMPTLFEILDGCLKPRVSPKEAEKN